MLTLDLTGAAATKGVRERMHVLGRVRLPFAVVVLAAVAACGGGGGGGGTIPGGGGGGPTPTPVPTATPTPNASGYVAPTGGVTLIPPATGNMVSSSMLNASADGTFVVQSSDTPVEPQASNTTLTEYNVSASQTTAGQVPGSVHRAPTAALREDFIARMPFRPALDPHSSSLRPPALHGRSTLQVARGISVQSVRRPSFVQGDTHQFHVIQGVITGGTSSCTSPKIPVGTSCYVNVTATLQNVSNHAYVWVDNAIDSTYNMTATDWSTTGTTFDADYARETVAFAPAFLPGPTPSYQQCDNNGTPITPQSSYAAVPDLSGTDPHISILITNALENTGEGGYFDFSALINDQELNCAVVPHIPSNNLPMFVIGADKYALSGGTQPDEPYWRNFDMPRSLPHEFQHYLHALNKVLKIDFSGTGAKGEFDDSFVDEGDSMLAEDLVNPGNAQSQDSLLLSFDYLYNPANFSLTAFTGYDADPLSTSQNPPFSFFRSTGGNYGAAYLFARYLYDRFGGDAALQRVYATITPGPSGSANVSPIVAEANGESFTQVYGEFAAALAARNVASTDPRFTFSSTVFLRGKKTVTVPGSQTWDIQMNGPRSPDDLTSSTPLGSPRIKLTPGGTVSAKLITGATLYFNVAAAGGSVVSGTVTGAPSIDAALTQGAYDDTGACLGPASSGC